jgi:hypothetical protein
MPSLESRRRAVSAALRAVATERLPTPPPAPALDRAVDEVHDRVEELSRRLDELERVVREQPVAAPTAYPDVATPPVSVPALTLAEPRMSSTAAKALFGH